MARITWESQRGSVLRPQRSSAESSVRFELPQSARSSATSGSIELQELPLVEMRSTLLTKDDARSLKVRRALGLEDPDPGKSISFSEVLFVLLSTSLFLQMLFPLLCGTTCYIGTLKQSPRLVCKMQIASYFIRLVVQALCTGVLLFPLRSARHLECELGDISHNHLDQARHHLRFAATHALVYYLYLSTEAWYYLRKKSLPLEPGGHVMWFTTLLSCIRPPLMIIALVLAQQVAYLRVDVLERSLFHDLGADLMLKLFIPQVACAIMLLPASAIIDIATISSEGGFAKISIPYWIIYGVFVTLHTIAYMIGARAFYITFGEVSKAREKLRGKSHELHKQAHHSARLQRNQVFGIFSITFSVAVELLSKMFWSLAVVHGPLKGAAVANSKNGTMELMLNTFPGLLNSISLGVNVVILSGALQLDFSIPGERMRAAQERDKRREKFLESHSEETNGAEWNKKVEELANRGVSLEKLLEFYTKLGNSGDLMRHFEPHVHTTADVVRQAIIPYSKMRQTACSDVIMGGAKIIPHRMVTHTWSGLFRDLVACVIADALGENEISQVTYLMENNMSEITRWLLRSGNLQRTYWICAFSVSQHASICGSNHNHDIDPVTGELHPVCDCGAPKFGNDAEPLDHERSIPCEMNKFQDMMTYLFCRSKDFEQVIAVDKDFVLFKRAWCVAEISEAESIGMNQNLIIPSRKSLNQHEKELERFRADDMEASRKEDKDEILAKIENKAEFEMHIKQLLLDSGTGLLASWKSMDTVQQMVHVGRLARFEIASAGRKSAWNRAATRSYGQMPSAFEATRSAVIRMPQIRFPQFSW